MRVHFIAVGEAVMHNLAIALCRKGYIVTGSDDEIFEPSLSRLKKFGLLPEKWGWDTDIITKDIDTVIPGIQVKPDNPELIKAKDLGIKIMSFPEYLYEQTKDKKRIVIAGSNGKTTITAMIMHVFRVLGIKFDFLAGLPAEGSENMAGLSDEARIAVFEGNEYLTSALDKRPIFHYYMPDIAVLNGIAWDHMNVFPTPEDYTEQFKVFVDGISDKGTLIYFDGDTEVKKIALSSGNNVKKIAYKVHGYFQNKTGFYAATHNRVVPVKIFGEHNMRNLSAAREVCLAIGVSEDDFYESIKSFEGTSKRLQKLKETEKGLVYLDVADTPSKVKATVEAIEARYPGRDIIACLELHSFAGLNTSFLSLYNGTLEKTTAAFIYLNPRTFKLKKLEHFSLDSVSKAFGDGNIKVYDNSDQMFSFIKSRSCSNPVYLFMSSGDFDGFELGMVTE
jgi:UDP-N-acetylmuramate: L-alanyl-gamma-D-glutamyl-meso-diaminopimelate ligase